MNASNAKNYITAPKNRKNLIVGSIVLIAIIVFFLWNKDYKAREAQQQTVQPQTPVTQQQVAPAQQQGQMVTAVVAVDQATGKKACQNTGLSLLVTLPEQWFCLKQVDQDKLGNMFMTNGALVIEVENLGRGIGCNPEKPECTVLPFYSNDLLDLSTAQINGENSGVFGIFNDNTDDVSYGGIIVRRIEGPMGIMTPEETQEVTEILDTFQRIGQQ